MTTSAVISAEEKIANDAKSHFSKSTASTLLSTAATGSAVKTSLRWREQCLLATSLPKIVSTLGNEYQKPWRYITSFSTNLGDQSNPADFLNKLYKHKDDEEYATPAGIVNDSFMNLKSDELSDISAKIELFKVLYDAQTDSKTKGVSYNYVADIPIAPVTMGIRDLKDFNTVNPITNITPGGRETSTHGFLPGADVSIDSFDWKYQGANPATVRNDISAQIVLGFSSFDQLSKVYTHRASDGKIYEYSALDLLGYGSTSPKMEKDDNGDLLCPDTYDPALVEVKAVLSLTLPNKSVQDPLEKIRIQGIEKKIKGIKEILYLTLIDHDFAIAQNGTFTLTLTYRARLEATLAQMRSNVVFSTSSDEYTQLVNLDQSIVAAQAEGCNESSTYDLVGQRSTKLREAWKTSFQKFFNLELSNVYMTTNASTRASQSEVLKGKLKGKKYDEERGLRNIWKMEYPRSSILSWLGGSLSVISEEKGPERSVSPTGDLKSAINDITTSEDDQSDFFGRIYNITGRATNHVVNFILFGDILEIMMHRAMSKQNFLTTRIETGAVSGDFGESGKIKIISGPVRIKIDDKTVICSISDIPISVEAFADFWYRNVISHEREVYSVLEFIRDISEELINKGSFSSPPGIWTHPVFIDKQVFWRVMCIRPEERV